MHHVPLFTLCRLMIAFFIVLSFPSAWHRVATVVIVVVGEFRHCPPRARSAGSHWLTGTLGDSEWRTGSDWMWSRFEIGVEHPHAGTQQNGWVPLLLRFSPDATPPLVHPSPLYLSRPKAGTLYHLPMLSSPITPKSRDAAACEETSESARRATYSRTLFEFTLRLWSESRRRAEELRKLEESAVVLNLSRPPQDP